MRLGLVVAVSDSSMDGVHRSVFLQAKTRQENDADDENFPAGRWYIYHRKYSDVIEINWLMSILRLIC